jgi:ribosomal protein S18 acetylase RimI-like enzyme
MPGRKLVTRHTGTFWMMDLGGPSPPRPAPRVQAEFCLAGSNDADAIAHVDGASDPAAVRQRFAGDRRCYVAWVDGTLAAFGWVSFSQELIGEIGLSINLLPGEAYVWDCVTAPAYRRRRLYSALLHHITTELRAHRMRRAWIGADLDNEPSQRGMALAGFEPVATLHMVRAAGWRVLWTAGKPNVSTNLVLEASRVMLGQRRRWLVQRYPAA